MTVWGIAQVIESNAERIVVGERLYGFFPMSSHAVMEPGHVSEGSFIGMLPHRQALPNLYNHYAGTRSESADLQDIEDESCIFFPLFVTGYVIGDSLADNSWHEAEQIIVGSASSKTGFSAAYFIKSAGFDGKIVGLTGSQNTSFCSTLGCYDQVLTYSQIHDIKAMPSVYVDMAGDIRSRSRLHQYLGDDAKRTMLVGATHWNQFAESVKNDMLQGNKPDIFFAPTQIEKRDAEWGRGAIMGKAYAASIRLFHQLTPILTQEYHAGVGACAKLWRALLDNQISGQRGVMVTLKDNN